MFLTFYFLMSIWVSFTPNNVSLCLCPMTIKHQSIHIQLIKGFRVQSKLCNYITALINFCPPDRVCASRLLQTISSKYINRRLTLCFYKRKHSAPLSQTRKLADAIRAHGGFFPSGILPGCPKCPRGAFPQASECRIARVFRGSLSTHSFSPYLLLTLFFLE